MSTGGWEQREWSPCICPNNIKCISETEVVGGEELPADPPSYESHHRHDDEEEEEEDEGTRESGRVVENQDPSSSTSVQGS